MLPNNIGHKITVHGIREEMRGMEAEAFFSSTSLIRYHVILLAREVSVNRLEFENKLWI